MEIGKPRRVHRVEPLKTPVPSRTAPPAEPARKERPEPKKVPAK